MLPAYVSLSMSTDYDCWHENHDDVTVEMIIKNLNSNAELAKQIITSAADMIDKERPKSFAHNALKDAIITPKDKVPEEIRERLEIFTSKYWN